MARWIRATVVAMLLVAASFAVLPDAQAQTGEGPLGCGIVWETNITYQVVPGDDAVSVDSENTLVYPKDAPDGCSIDRVPFNIPEATVDIVAKDSAGSLLDVSVESPSEPGFSSRAVIELSDRLDRGDTEGFNVSYLMPDDGAFTSVAEDTVRFHPWVWGTPGLVTLEVVVGAGDTIVSSTPEPLEPVSGSAGSYVATAIANPDDWIDPVVVYRDGERATSSIDVSGYPVVLHTLSIDSSWEQDVTGNLASGIPALEGLIGLPWPDWKPLDVVEVDDEALNGYGGVYMPTEHTIKVPRDVPQALMLHEIGHAWFNDASFADTWVSEGLAEAYAFQAELIVADIDGYDPVPARFVDPTGTGSIPLASWEVAEEVDAASESTVEYGYAASFWVIDQVIDEIGVDALSDVVVAATAEAGDAGQPVSSVRFLTLLQDVGGSEQAEDLFATYGAVDGGESVETMPPTAAPPVIAQTPSAAGQQVPPLAPLLVIVVLAGAFTLIYRSRRTPAMGERSGYVSFAGDPFNEREIARQYPGATASDRRPAQPDWVDTAGLDPSGQRRDVVNVEPWVY